MGYYINPPNESKEDFLAKHGARISEDQVREFDFAGTALPVCLVDNRAFTAAGIAYDKREVEEFLHPDNRSKQWFSVGRKELEPYYKSE